MNSSRAFWITTTVAFVLTWFVFVPYLVRNEVVDLTAPVAADDRFTDWRGWNMTNDHAKEQCMKAVYIAGSKVAAKHHTAPLDTPDRIYMQCMHAHKVIV